MDWNWIITTLGGTTIFAAALSFLAKSVANQVLKRDLERYKHNLQRESKEQLLAHENAFKRQMEVFRSELTKEAARGDRIREEVEKWANPILAAIDDLERRLKNILKDDGYRALSKDFESHEGWSADRAYFLPSTVYLFCQYFCWIRLLEEKLSFELFERHDLKDGFFDRVREAGRQLSEYPLEELMGMPGHEADRQIFTLEQRAVGETLAKSGSGEKRCMGYAEFLDNWRHAAFRKKLESVVRMVDEIDRSCAHRWRRLELFAENLRHLQKECRVILDLEKPQKANIATAESNG